MPRRRGDWLAVGLDPRPERLAAFPWRRAEVPTLDALVEELVAAGVRRLVLTHGGTSPDPAFIAARSCANNGRIRPFTFRSDDAHNSSVASIDAPTMP